MKSRDAMRSAFSRRGFLRGAGAAIALPWLESLRAHPIASPTRMAILVMPNGVLQSAWKPDPDGAGGWQPSFSLEPLAARRSEVSVLTGLANRGSFSGDGHYAKVAPLLTGATIRRTGGRDLRNEVSMDQVAARAIGAATPLPSLELGCDPIHPVEDMGYSTVYGGSLSWTAPDRPATKLLAPRAVFDRMFRSRALADDPLRKSVLDVVRDDAARLSRRASARDQRRLDEFSESVRALELRIEAAERATRAAVDPSRAPEPGVPADYPTHVALMLDLVALAFETDTTRVVTFLMANEVSGRPFPFVEGCSGGFHDYSHHENKPEKQEPYKKINRWHVAQFASLLDRLAQRQEGEGSLLDASMLVLASAMSDGNAHDPHDLPVLLAGRGGRTIDQGRLVASKRDTPLCSLWLAMLRRMGVHADRFGDADRPLL